MIPKLVSKCDPTDLKIGLQMWSQLQLIKQGLRYTENHLKNKNKSKHAANKISETQYDNHESNSIVGS